MWGKRREKEKKRKIKSFEAGFCVFIPMTFLCLLGGLCLTSPVEFELSQNDVGQHV